MSICTAAMRVTSTSWRLSPSRSRYLQQTKGVHTTSLQARSDRASVPRVAPAFTSGCWKDDRPSCLASPSFQKLPGRWLLGMKTRHEDPAAPFSPPLPGQPTRGHAQRTKGKQDRWQLYSVGPSAEAERP